MAYTLTSKQQQNALSLLQKMTEKGITNAFTKAAILAVISKETELNPAASEVSYAKTSNDRIRKIFSKTKTVDDAQLNTLKANSKLFFDFVYNGIAGNGPTDGFAFRGRGYNQLTGRGNYKSIGDKIGIDLVKNPDRLVEPDVAAAAVVVYFQNGMDTLKKLKKLEWYHSVDINGFKTVDDALGAIYHVNAGAGHNKAHLDADVTGGRAKAMSRVNDLLNFVNTQNIA